MKKLFIFVVLILTIHSTIAEEHHVLMEFHSKTNSQKHTEVNRSCTYMPIKIMYNSDISRIKITTDYFIEGKVYLYNRNGILIDLSNTLNTEIFIEHPDLYLIVLKGNDWYAEGTINTND